MPWKTFGMGLFRRGAHGACMELFMGGLRIKWGFFIMEYTLGLKSQSTAPC